MVLETNKAEGRKLERRAGGEFGDLAANSSRSQSAHSVCASACVPVFLCSCVTARPRRT